LKRAKIEQLETILKILPWVATIDEFQHWIYENPTHSVEQRQNQWEKISKDYGTGLVDWSGYEDFKSRSWQRQLHLFEVPFYYIEYGIAQLGALAIWKNSKKDLALAIQDYKSALKLGYTQQIPEIYQTAGIEFNFSEKYIQDLAQFLKKELENLNN
jgi:oligoendopeptidase F